MLAVVSEQLFAFVIAAPEPADTSPALVLRIHELFSHPVGGNVALSKSS